MKFGGQTFKNVHGIWKVCLETTLRVFERIAKFNMFILDDIHVIGFKLIYEPIRVGNVRAEVSKDQPRVPEEAPVPWIQECQDNRKRRRQ